jgi:hypothetical protein
VLHPARICQQVPKLLPRRHPPEFEKLHDEIRALRKVAVKGTDSDTCFVRDLSHRGFHSGRFEHRHGRSQQLVDIALRIGARLSIRPLISVHAASRVFRFILHQISIATGTVFHI